VHRHMARGIAAVVAGAALSAAGASGTGLPGTAAAAAQVASAGSAGTSPAAAPSGSRLWISRYNGPPGTDNVAASMAVSPDGTRVFVTGWSARARTGPGGEFATVGYKTATGARLWAQRYHGPAGGTAEARSVAISPDGTTVFVTGTILNVQRTDYDYVTIAYQAATGAVRWIARYDGPGSPSDDQAYAVAVSRDGRTVFVTGSSTSPDRPRGDGSTTIAYRAATGTRQWLAHYNGSGGRAVAVSPRGGEVIITGTNGRDYGTVAYRAATGTRLWARHHDGPAGARDYGGATALAFSPDGSTVFVTGDSHDPGTPHAGVTYATIAYRATDGTQRWAVSDGPLASTGGAEAVAVSPDGRTVLVTGNDYATVAYRAATGAQLWASPGLDASRAGTGAQERASRSLGGYATALAVSPDGHKVFVTGRAFDPVSGNGIREFTVVALSTATGARLWVNRYQGPRNLGGTGVAVAVSPAGRRVYVAGSTIWAIPRTLAARYAIIAYRA
jgi:DNA-binding beta-propeller fold protein YncE